MSNPFPGENEIFERIEREGISVDPDIWKLIQHYIGNDVYKIQLIAGTYTVGDAPEPIPPDCGRKIIEHTEEIVKFLKRLREATRK